MANMSYCRFENTLRDLRDCFKALQNGEIESDSEKKKAKQMLEEMAEFLVEEDIINIEDDDININYDGIKEWIYGCD